MKSRSFYRAKSDHATAASNARAHQGRWVMAGIYPSSSSAKNAVRRVRIAELMPAYEPAGAYEAYAAMHDDGYALWVRHVAGDQPVPVLPDRMTVRIRHDGYGPECSGVGVITVTVSTRCPRCGGPRGFDIVAPYDFCHRGDWYVVDRWTNFCGHVDVDAAVLKESRDRPLPAPRPPVPAAPQPPDKDSPAGVILAAAEGRRGMCALGAIQVLETHGYAEEAERVRAEIRVRATGGHMSAKQVARFLHDAVTTNRNSA
ncbi:hypothetical protein ACFRFL_13825 [Streptomyces sp. NPDC056708]|uniref:hypothetical protein n=1 Tax=unclassified Streptomyces TaxID=2593676 RepID=UPI0036990BA5